MEKNKNSFMDFDLFAVPFNFKYQRMDKYSTIFSFIFSSLYLLFSMFFISFYLIFFFMRQNFDFKDYEGTEKNNDILNYMKSKLDFAYRLDCGEYVNIKPIEDLLQVDIKVNFYEYYDRIGMASPIYKDFSIYNCTYDNKNQQLKKVDKSNYKCINLSELDINNKNYIFESYEMNVSLKNSSQKEFYYFNEFLLNHTCKIEISFIDYLILINNYNNPIDPYKNSLFLRLNSFTISEMNIYFIKKKLIDKNNLILLGDEGKTREFITLSHYRNYFNYKGDYTYRLKRKNVDVDYKTYAKILISAYPGISITERKYQNLWECIGVISSILMAIYTILDFIFGSYNQFALNHTLTKKIFFFKDVKDEHINYFPNNHKIINLINKMKDINNPSNNDNNDIDNDNDIKFYENIIKSNIKNSIYLNQKDSIAPKNTEVGQESNLNFNIPQDTEKNISEKELKPREIEFSYNKFEIFFNKCLCCCYCCRCMPKNFQLKKQITSKAMEIISDKLDIVLYIRNTILLDLMKKILLGDDKEGIIKFLNRPILSLKENNNLQITNLNGKQKQNNNIIKINENYSDIDFENCEKEVNNLASNKKVISEVDRKLIFYTKKQLLQLFGD